MAKINVLNVEGKQVGEMELNDAVFGVDVNEHVLHRAVVTQLANKRQGTQSAKTRGEVRGGGAKPWRQKGTGRARQGSIRSPQWKGGGVVFAPKPRDYSKKLNKKERRVALRSALTLKVIEQNFIVLDQLVLDEIKTKQMVNVFGNLSADKPLVILPEVDNKVILSTRNIEGARAIPLNTINVYELLKHKTCIVTKEVVQALEEVYA